MRLVVIDLIPALLSWEGRNASGEAEIAPDADGTLQDIYDMFRIEGVADSEISGSTLRDTLYAHGIGEWFERIASSAEFGPVVTPRVIRRIASGAGVQSDQMVAVTAREHLADRLRKERLAVVLTGGLSEFWAVPEALQELRTGFRP